QLVEELRPFLVDDPEIDPAAAAKHLTPELRPVLLALADELSRAAAFDAASLEAVLRATAERAGLKAAALIHATRVAVTGRTVSGGLFEVLALLGQARVIHRLQRSAHYTSAA